MPKRISLAAALAAGASFLPFAAHAEYFNRIASFPTNLNLPADVDQATENSAEIIAASEDGMTLYYSDSPLGAIGMIDITDPANPAPKGVVMLDGEPTAVSVKGAMIFAAINTSQSYTAPSGKLITLTEAGDVTGSCDLGGQPDSIAVAPDGAFVTVAIENERDEDLNDGVIPQMPAGYVAIIPLGGGAMDCDGLIKADVTGNYLAGTDPEPEFVDVNAAGDIVVSMQENNQLAVIGADGAVKASFSAGAVTLENVDTAEERALTFDDTLEDVVREPDAVQWLDETRFVTANEGDWKGGSRGFTIFSATGEELFESGLSFEYEVAMHGHYPERRSGNKGAEPEGMEVGTYGDQTYIFLLSERGSVIGVYKDTGGAPELHQMLPTALGPEGAVAIPERNLLAVSNEVDLIEDGGVRSHVTIYELGGEAAKYPSIRSGMDGDRPIGWGALSGLTQSDEPGVLYAVNDSFYALQPTIFRIDATQTPAMITDAIRVTRGGFPAQKMDMEGITPDGQGGFFIASEGRTDRLTPHAIYHVGADGQIEDEIPFPAELLAVEKRFGSEGIAKAGDTLWITIQREWLDDEAGTVKLVSYNLETEEWGAVRYPLDAKGKGWIGLSDIAIHEGTAYILERDNQIGANAAVKRIYSVPLADMTPAPLGGDLPMVNKTLVMDVLPVMAADGGYVLDKIEGLAIDAAGQMYAVTDNDGIDDHNGETQFLRLGAVK